MFTALFSRRNLKCVNSLGIPLMTHVAFYFLMSLKQGYCGIAYSFIQAGLITHNGLSPGWHRAFTWTNVGILLIRTLGTIFSDILSEIHTFLFTKNAFENLVCDFALGPNVLKRGGSIAHICIPNQTSLWHFTRGIDRLSLLGSKVQDRWYFTAVLLDTVDTMTSSNGNIFLVLAFCAGIHPSIPSQRPVTRSFEVFFDLHLDKR